MSYTLTLYKKSGDVLESLALNADVFTGEVNDTLLQEYFVMYTSNIRNAIAHTKTRGEVSYAGKKLFRQKGTGNARSGNAGSPIKRHGGVAFGPRSNASFKKAMPQKMKRAALRSALNQKLVQSSWIGIEDNFLSSIKTKEAATVLKNINVSSKRTLVVINNNDANIVKSFANMPHVEVVLAQLVNPYQIMTSHTVITDKSSLAIIDNLLTQA